MAKLVLLRHGQSYTNEGREVAKEQQNLLSRAGVQQSLDNTIAFRKANPDLHFDLALMSPYQRALQTGLNFLSMSDSKPVDIIVDHRLCERSYGFENFINIKQLIRDYGADEVASWDSDLYSRPSRDGETQLNVYERVMASFRDNIRPALDEGKNVIVVAHFYVLKALQSSLEHNGPSKMPEFDPKNCTPYIYDYSLVDGLATVTKM
jgi:2,3-bisphosphoglycerate-dependent phosphoglycerate mutase